MAIYKQLKTLYNVCVMDTKNSAATEERDLERFQIYLGGDLKDRFKRYIEHWKPTWGNRITTITVRRALDEFLKKEGF